MVVLISTKTKRSSKRALSVSSAADGLVSNAAGIVLKVTRMIALSIGVTRVSDMYDSFKYCDGKLVYAKKVNNRIKVGQEVGKQGNRGYRLVSINRKTHLVHRVIWEMHYGAIPDGYVIDHINGDKSDNHIENLRIATQSQNVNNQPSRCYSYDKTVGSYKVQLQLDGRRKNIGRYKDEELAELVADEAKLKYYGDFYRSV